MLSSALAATLLTGCGNDETTATDENSSQTASPTSAKVTLTDLNKVKINPKVGSDLKVSFDGVFGTTNTTRRVVTPGKGRAVAMGDKVVVNYAIVNGRDKKVFDTVANKTPATFVLRSGQLKGLTDALTGVKVGSRFLAAVPPKDYFGSKGNPDVGVSGTDSILIAMDVLSATPAHATGKTVSHGGGKLPKVTWGVDYAPTITLPKTKAPTTLVSQNLIEGTGRKVKASDKVSVQYEGIIWPGGKVFDSTWRSQQEPSMPKEFPLNGVVKGWTQGLAGKNVGSRVLLVIPPKLGYGTTGEPQAGIKGTDTLVFVVDIIGAK